VQRRDPLSRDLALEIPTVPGLCNWLRPVAMRMANALQSPGLIELNDTEHLGVTDRGKSQPQQYAGREKQSAKDSRNYFKAGPLAIVRLFHRQRCAHTSAAIKLRPTAVETHFNISPS
jgi:hypothetical protein